MPHNAYLSLALSQATRVKIIPASSNSAAPPEAPVLTPEQKAELAAKSAAEYEALKQKLLLLTLGFTAVITLGTFLAYGWKIALSYVIGGCVGVVYLRMLSRGVDRLGTQTKRLGLNRFGVFIILIVVASRWEHLSILPAFFGFLTYKIAVLVITAQDLTRR